MSVPLNGNWTNDKARGDRGENHWALHLQDRGYVVIDSTLQQDKRGQDLFAIKDGEVTVFDVKVDGRAWETGNLAFELYSEYPDGRTRDGWAQKSTADYYVFILETPSLTGVRYIAIEPDQVVAQLPKLKEEQRTIYTDRDSNKRTYSVLCPIDQLDNYFTNIRKGQLKTWN